MIIPPLPKSWLIHEIVYEGYTGEKDSWGNPKYDNPITIKCVRFDDSTVFSRDNTQTKVLANAVIFVDAKNSTNVPNEFKEESKVTFNGKEYVIKKIVTCYQANSKEIHHLELEVI